MKTKKPDKSKKNNDIDFEKSLQKRIEEKFHKKVVIDHRISESAKQI